MRTRLRKLLNLVADGSEQNQPPEPNAELLTVKRVQEERSSAEAKRRLEETRVRLKREIPVPKD